MQRARLNCLAEQSKLKGAFNFQQFWLWIANEKRMHTA